MSNLPLDNIRQELAIAVRARESGNEGKARVCCRRAAGIAIAEFMQRENIPVPGPSAIERLKFVARSLEMDDQIREIAEHLMLRVNEDFDLPIKVDLIEETRQLIEYLLSDYELKEKL
jgi:hypothetical protein